MFGVEGFVNYPVIERERNISGQFGRGVQSGEIRRSARMTVQNHFSL
jgi:hypothetical protein